MNSFNIPDEDIPRLLEQHREWGDVKVPLSLQEGLTEDQERDLRIILEDRRVTDLSAQYWMKMRRGLTDKEKWEKFLKEDHPKSDNWDDYPIGPVSK